MRSRASSRSTAIPHSDTAEGSERPPTKPRRPHAKSRRIRRRPTEHEDTDFEPGRLGSKRPRNPKSRDKTEPPPKRIRLRSPSIKTLHLVIVSFMASPPLVLTPLLQTDSQSSIASGDEVTAARQQDTPQLQRPDELESSQSEGDHSQRIESGDRHTSGASWSLALQRKPTCAVPSSSLPSSQASSSSLPLNQASTAVGAPSATHDVTADLRIRALIHHSPLTSSILPRTSGEGSH